MDSKGFHRASNAPSSSIQNVGVDHDHFHDLKAEQSLDPWDVVAAFELNQWQ